MTISGTHEVTLYTTLFRGPPNNIGLLGSLCAPARVHCMYRNKEGMGENSRKINKSHSSSLHKPRSNLPCNWEKRLPGWFLHRITIISTVSQSPPLQITNLGGFPQKLSSIWNLTFKYLLNLPLSPYEQSLFLSGFTQTLDL